MKALTPRQEKFVRAYLKSGNATKAYIEAGYSAAGAEKHASRLVGNGGVAAAIAARRASTEIVIARKTVADMAELEEHFTSQLRGGDYQTDIDELEDELAELREEREHIRKVRTEKREGLSPETLASLAQVSAQLGREIVQARLQIKNLRLSQKSESNKAGVTLLKLKGAFDPKRPPVDDPMALLNETMRHIMLMRRPPSEILAQLKAAAKDAAYSLRSEDVEDDVQAIAGGNRGDGGPRLFTRAPAPDATP